MKRHKTWYKRELFKKHFKTYKDWDYYNPPSGDKQPGRYRTDALQCQNPQCPREGMKISEHEAFYCYSKEGYFKKIYQRAKKIMRGQKTGKGNNFYICPFCGGDDVREN